MARKPLRVVSEGEASEPKRPLTLLQAVDAGDYLAELRAMHKRIATAVADPNTPARDLASLTRRQLEISKEINAITSAENGDEVGNAAATPDEEWATS